MLNVTLYRFLIFSSLLWMTACGSDHSGYPRTKILQNQVEEKQDDQGRYRVVLNPLNTDYSGEVLGTFEIKIQGEDFFVQGHLANARAGVKYLQNIMLGNKCPDNAADINEDSIIDLSEVFHVSGKVLLPLDADLSEQLSGMDFGPIANTSGSYIYRRSTTLSQLLSDLRMPDPDILDHVLKLPPENDLNLAGKVVLIMGLPDETALPESVSRVGTLSSHQAFPIACGNLFRIKDDGIQD